MLVEVTQGDIDGGVMDRACRCPVSLALQRAFKQEEIYVQFSHFTVGQWPTYLLPRSAERFIRAFDSGKPVAPFRFRVRVNG